VDHVMLPGLLARWVGQLAAPLHGRISWRMARLVAGILLAHGRRTASIWWRAAGAARAPSPLAPPASASMPRGVGPPRSGVGSCVPPRRPGLPVPATPPATDPDE
jgi:hypothetical protein